MSIIYRQTTKRAGGGDIIRTVTFETGPVSIGRGADCDVNLSDLAASLNHAVLRLTRPGEIVIDAVGPQRFGLDGRLVSTAILKANGQYRISFGDQVLTISPGNETQDAVLDLSIGQGGGQGGSEGPSQLDEAAIFSPGAGVFGKRAMAWTLGIGIVLICLVLPIAALNLDNWGHSPAKGGVGLDHQWSSGPLSKSHAFLDKDCQSCHQKAFVSVRDETCLTCHKAERTPAALAASAAAIRAQGSDWTPNLIKAHAAHDRMMAVTPMPAGLGAKVTTFVSRAFNHGKDRCASCHIEHVSANAAPDAPNAAKGPRREIPALAEATDCADCHAKLSKHLTNTALIDTANWKSHPNFRPLVTVSAPGEAQRLARVPIALKPQDNSGLVFSHKVHLETLGSVTRMSLQLGKQKGYGSALTCQSCHQNAAGTKDLRPIQMEKDCGSCHSLAFVNQSGQIQTAPHGDTSRAIGVLNGQASSAGLSAAALARTDGARRAFGPGGLCIDCHVTAKNSGAGTYGIGPVRVTSQYLVMGAFDHQVKEHSLMKNGAPGCADCHNSAKSDDARDVSLPTIEVCANCHGKTKAQSKHPASADCTECHSFHAPGQSSLVPTQRHSFVDTPRAAKAPARHEAGA